MEYQLSRPIFLRLVGEYLHEQQTPLRDDTRTEGAILIFDPGVNDFVRADAFTRSSFRGELLFSYQPNPGTVAFLGYGSSMETDAEFNLSRLSRVNDGFFVKLAYQYRP